MPKQAVLLLAHGTPETIEQIPAYLRNVVSGRPLPQHLIEEIQRRYTLIGHSPLTEITMEQARLVEIELSHPSGKNKDAARVGHPAAGELAAIGASVPVYVAMRNWRPYIPDVIKKMRADGVEEFAALCLAPHNSRTSVGLYRRAVEAESAGLRIDFTEGWAQHPLLIEAFAERLRPAFTRLSAEVGAPVPVLFTAHSVPSADHSGHRRPGRRPLRRG
jgi:ferrochelatase